MQVRTFALPVVVRSRGLLVREGLLVRGAPVTGPGWREFSPFTDYPPWMDARWWRACAEDPATWPARQRDRIPVAVNVPAVTPDVARTLVAAGRDCTTAKVRVGTGEVRDVARVEAVRDALGPHGRIRVAVNGSWGRDEAVSMLRRLSGYGLEFAEQPCASLEDCAYVRRRTGVPIALDESIRLSAAPELDRIRDYADIAVLKVHPLGGVRAALTVADRVGLPAVVSSALETSIGIRAGLGLAAALPELPYACALNTVSLFDRDVAAAPEVVDGALTLSEVDDDEVLIDAPPLSSERERWWRRRLERAAMLGEQPSSSTAGHP
jgi:O-succinylbenzoate synthase